MLLLIVSQSVLQIAASVVTVGHDISIISPQGSEDINNLLMSEYVWVYVFLVDAKTVLPIISKLGMVIEGHLAGKIDLVSCA